jgi:hypothetical protein
MRHQSTLCHRHVDRYVAQKVGRIKNLLHTLTATGSGRNRADHFKPAFSDATTRQ